MSTISKTDATYVMGHPTGEEVRLQQLGQLLYPSTRHLFEKAGIPHRRGLKEKGGRKARQSSHVRK